jgi:hypothetical protein
MLSRSQRMIKRRRELLAVYVPTDSNLWRRAYPETFYPHDNPISVQELEYIDNIYGIFMAIIDGYRKTLIEDEINLMYIEIEMRASLGKFSEEVLSAVRGRLGLKKQVLQRIESLAKDVESELPEFAQKPPQVKFRLESTVYLVRLLAYGLFSDNDIVLDRVAEVFDIAKLQAATKPRDRREMDETLKFLYRGLIQKNERGRQGNRHAARQTLDTMREWFPDNEYVIMCIEKIGKYV